MAASYHVRSNSFPSRPHPVAAQVDEQLRRLRSSETASTSSSSICPNLNGLQDLYDCIEKLLQLPLAQESLSQEQNKKVIDELLDGSLRLLDVCNIAKDALLQMKEGLQEIQSVMRRKRGDFTSEVKKYLASRKSLKKSFHKVLKSLKAADNNNNDDETLSRLREAEAVTVSMFESLLSFVSGPKSDNKWALVSKLMKKKRVACEEEAEANEFTRVDAALHSIIDNKSEIKIEDVKSLEMCIQDLEEGLECLYRSMIKQRVTMLNMPVL